MEQKERIYETAFQLFTRVGYSGVTMDCIARNCGIGKATLYKYFPSKEQMLLDCIDYFTEKLGAEMESILANPDLSPQRKATGFIAPVVRFVSQIHGGAALQDIRRNVPEAYEKIDRNRRRLIFANIVRIVEEGRKSGIFRENLNSTLVAHVLTGAISHLASPEILEEVGLPSAQMLEETLSVVWEGCLSEKGRGDGG